MHFLLSPAQRGDAPRVRRGRPAPGAGHRGHEQRRQPHDPVQADEQDLRPQAEPEHRAEGALRQHRRRSAMTPAMIEKLREPLPQVTGYIYPNEIEVHWGLLIVVYPYITGIVAGAFILASLVKVFNVKEVQPLYRLPPPPAPALLPLPP